MSLTPEQWNLTREWRDQWRREMAAGDMHAALESQSGLLHNLLHNVDAFIDAARPACPFCRGRGTMPDWNVRMQTDDKRAVRPCQRCNGTGYAA